MMECFRCSKVLMVSSGRFGMKDCGRERIYLFLSGVGVKFVVFGGKTPSCVYLRHGFAINGDFG
jgi:hypothetical protein